MSTTTRRHKVEHSQTSPPTALNRNQSTLLHPSAPDAHPRHPPEPQPQPQLHERPRNKHHHHTTPLRHRASNDYAPRSVSHQPSTKVKPKLSSNLNLNPNRENEHASDNANERVNDSNAPPPQHRYDTTRPQRPPMHERKTSSLLHPSTPPLHDRHAADTETQKHHRAGTDSNGYFPKHSSTLTHESRSHTSPALEGVDTDREKEKKNSVIHSSQSLVPDEEAAVSDDDEDGDRDGDGVSDISSLRSVRSRGGSRGSSAPGSPETFASSCEGGGNEAWKGEVGGGGS